MTSAAKILRPTIANINLGAFRRNILRMQELVSPAVGIMLSIKADAYGHNALEIARICEKENLCRFLSVALIEEGIELRKHGIKMPILVLGSIYPFTAFADAIKHNLSVTIASMDSAKELARYSEKADKQANCHIKIDTGLGRIGARKEGALAIAEYLAGEKSVKIEGIYTHFSSADSDMKYTLAQIKEFNIALSAIRAKKIDCGITHSANSAGALNFAQSRYDMVRPGLAVYGLADGFEPVMSITSKIVYLKDAMSGASISYGRSFICSKQTRIATIPVGYGDGYPRSLSNKAEVLIRGKRCKILGAVTMDMVMADISEVKGASAGDEVVLLGRQDGEEITAGELAKLAGTISYEIVTCITKRVPRVFADDK